MNLVERFDEEPAFGAFFLGAVMAGVMPIVNATMPFSNTIWGGAVTFIPIAIAVLGLWALSTPPGMSWLQKAPFLIIVAGLVQIIKTALLQII